MAFNICIIQKTRPVLRFEHGSSVALKTWFGNIKNNKKNYEEFFGWLDEDYQNLV